MHPFGSDHVRFGERRRLEAHTHAQPAASGPMLVLTVHHLQPGEHLGVTIVDNSGRQPFWQSAMQADANGDLVCQLPWPPNAGYHVQVVSVTTGDSATATLPH